jgi:hypothetical protein
MGGSKKRFRALNNREFVIRVERKEEKKRPRERGQ